ncbi:hypothetical protein EYR36_010552 [Pleurotus pulmonarius]|nr:hypothetical protein EYR36_010552 [Pleurotus pulmonarius]
MAEKNVTSNLATKADSVIVIPAKRSPSPEKEDKSIEDATPMAKKQRSMDETASVIKSEATLVKITSLLDDALALSKELGPLTPGGISASRHARALAISLLNAIPEDPAIRSLNVNGYKNSINSTLKHLKSSCKNDYHDGYEEQAEYMEQISKKIAKWLPHIWNVLQTEGNLLLARTCIVFCTETVGRIDNCRTRAEYSDQDAVVRIKNEAGEVVFESSLHIRYALTWFWKELLIIDATPKPDPFSSTILADLKKFDQTEGVFELIEEPDEEDDSIERFDKHWTPEMHAAGKRLVESRQNERIEEFMKAPSLGLYNRLVTESLKPTLLEGVRKDLTQRWHRIPLKDAIEIFKQNDLIDDIIPLIATTQDDTALRSIAKILSNARSKKEEYRTTALKLITKGLFNAHSEIMNEIRDSFPRLDDAEFWLEDVVYEKYTPEVLQKDEAQRDPAVTREIETIVDEFIRKAGGYPRRDRRYGSEPPDLTRPILDWLQVLGEWPDKAKAEETWNAIRWKTNDDPFGVNGILLMMSYYCEDGRGYLSEAIRAMIKVYTCKDMQELTKYIPKRTSHGSSSSISYPTFF